MSIERAVEICGTQAALAERLGVTPQAVHKWMNGQRVTAERAIDIERATSGAVTRYDLRPDIFGQQVAA